jgi:hypothetical protein
VQAIVANFLMHGKECCKFGRNLIKLMHGVVVAIDGTVFAPPAVDATSWIMFHYADGLAIRGGTLDGQGRAHWACRADPGRNCPHATTVSH